MSAGNLAWAVVTDETKVIKIENLHPNRLAAQERRAELDRLAPRYQRKVIPVRIVPVSLHRRAKGGHCEA